MDNKRLEKWKLKMKGIFHKITYDEFWFYIDDLMKENKKLTNNWNELEEYIRNKFLYYSDNTRELDEDTILYCLHKKDVYREVLDKMKEIKEGK